MATTSEVRRVSIYINGQEADMQLGQIERGAKKLRNELSRLTPGTEAFRAKLMQLRETRAVIRGVQDEINGVSGAFGWLKTEVGKLGMLATGFLGLQFITQQFQNVISQNAKLSDSIADIQKTTGMSELAVRRLQHSFKELDTRTSRAELNGLAEVAGKLGITGERDVMGFVRAADQINVALGKDLGNAEQAINDLGKLTEIFKIKDAFGLEQALLKTGSAINGLGAIGTANEGYIVEFTKRLGGIAPQAKMTIQDVMALGAVMDELGQPVEASATALGQFIIGLGNDTSKFAKIAGMTKKAFEDLLSKDGTAALKSVLNGLKTTGQGVQDLAENMGIVGEDGARATAALGVLSNNLDLLNTRQGQANKLFDEGTSLTQEYNVKNTNFAASLDRLSKKFGELTANHSLTDMLVGVVNGTIKVIDWINRCAATIGVFFKLITLGGIAWLTYSTYLAIANAESTAFLVNLIRGDAVMKMSRATTIALAGVKALLAGNLTKAAQAARLLNVALAANPIGALVAAVVVAISAFVMFNRTLTDTEKVQNSINDVMAEGDKAVRKETTTLQLAMDTLKKRNISKQQEAQAIKTIRDLMPDHLQGYTDEEIRAGKATEAINKYIDSLSKRARATAAQNKLDAIAAEEVDIQLKLKNGYKSLDTWEWLKYGFEQNFVKKMNEKLASLKVERQQIEEVFGADILNNNAAVPNLNIPTGGNTFDLKNATKDELEQQLAKDAKAIAHLKQGTEEYNKVAAEMLAIRKRLKEIGKDTGLGGGNKEETAAKKAAAAFKQLEKDAAALNRKAREETLNRNEKEIADAESKYKTLIDREIEFRKMEGATQAQKIKSLATQKQLEGDMARDTAAIRVRQEQDSMTKIMALRRSLAKSVQSERDAEIERINAFYDDLQENVATNEEDLFYFELARQKDLSDAKIREEKRLGDALKALKRENSAINGKTKSRDDGENGEKATIDKKAEDQVEQLKKDYSPEIQATQEFQDLLQQIEMNRIDATHQYEMQRKQELRKAVIAAAGETARLVADTIFEIGADNRRAETDAQLSELDKRKERELANKNLTESQKQAIDKKYQKLEADIKLKAWKADQSAKRAQAVINGALGVTMALASSPPPMNWINAALVGAATIAQVIKISAEKPPAFEDGGFSSVDYKKPQGWVRSPTLFKNSASGRDFTAGEKFKSEYIISSEQLKDPVISNFVGMMETNRGVRRFEAGGYSGVDSPVSGNGPGSTGMTPVTVVNDYTMLTDEMRKNREAIEALQLGFSLELFNKKVERINKIKQDATA